MAIWPFVVVVFVVVSLVFLLSIMAIGVAAYMLIRKTRLVNCPDCLQFISPNALFCPRCGRSQTVQPPKLPAAGDVTGKTAG